MKLRASYRATGSNFLPPEVSVITVYYNTPAELKNLGASMETFLPADVYEWIIADNDSSQDLSSEMPASLYLRMPENYGFAKANNVAVQSASSSLLFFVNPDCEFVENCLPALFSELRHSAVAAPLVLNTDGTIQVSFGPELSLHGELMQKIRMRYERSAFLQKRLRSRTSAPFAVDYVSGCALMTSRETFLSIGGFDENFFLYEEDVDLCKRIRQSRGAVRVVPSTRIIHHRNRSTDLHRSRARLEYRRSQRHYYAKHQSAFQRLLLNLYLSAKGEMK